MISVNDFKNGLTIEVDGAYGGLWNFNTLSLVKVLRLFVPR